MKSIVIVASATVIAASFATSAVLADPVRTKDPVASEQVSFADLDLKSAKGRQRLKDRISFAAYGLCLVDPGASPSPAFPDSACFKRAIDGGLRQMERAVAETESHPELASAAPRRR